MAPFHSEVCPSTVACLHVLSGNSRVVFVSSTNSRVVYGSRPRSVACFCVRAGALLEREPQGGHSDGSFPLRGNSIYLSLSLTHTHTHGGHADGAFPL